MAHLPVALSESGDGQQADHRDQREAEQNAGRQRHLPGPRPAGEQRCPPACSGNGPGCQQPAGGAPGGTSAGECGDYQPRIAEIGYRRSCRCIRVQAVLKVMLAGLIQAVSQFLDKATGQVRGQAGG
jgi:hypothetical protein